MIVVIMGVMGAGKTAVGSLLADMMHVPFIDADDHHSAKNKEKMGAGTPLDDADRQPWLEKLNGFLKEWHAGGTGGVMACSALKEAYRDTLRGGMPAETVHFVFLDTPRALLAERIVARRHQYMNPALLDSQLETLEEPADAIVIMNDRLPQDIAQDIFGQL